MSPSYHFLINFAASCILVYFSPDTFTLGSIFWITFAGIVIDLDHIFYYLINGGDPKKDFINKRPHFYIFHTIEFVILITILAIFYPVMFFILIGILIHLICDIITYAYHKNYDWIPYWSAIYYLIRFK